MSENMIEQRKTFDGRITSRIPIEVESEIKKKAEFTGSNVAEVVRNVLINEFSTKK